MCKHQPRTALLIYYLAVGGVCTYHHHHDSYYWLPSFLATTRYYYQADYYWLVACLIINIRGWSSLESLSHHTSRQAGRQQAQQNSYWKVGSFVRLGENSDIILLGNCLAFGWLKKKISHLTLIKNKVNVYLKMIYVGWCCYNKHKHIQACF